MLALWVDSSALDEKWRFLSMFRIFLEIFPEIDLAAPEILSFSASRLTTFAAITDQNISSVGRF